MLKLTRAELYKISTDSGVETYCLPSENENEVRLVTKSENKYEWLSFLGLVTGPKELCEVETVKSLWNDEPEYKWYTFTVVKLLTINHGSWYDLNDEYHDDFRKFSRVDYVEDIKEGSYGIFQAVIDYVKNLPPKLRIRQDIHAGNILICPITGHVYPYDVIFIPTNEEIEKELSKQNEHNNYLERTL